MRRRQVLAVGATALAGCTASPEPPAYTTSPPNVFLSREWTGSAHRLTFEYGTTVTERNTDELFVRVDETGDRYTWVSVHDAGQRFPVEPGDTLTVEAEREATLLLIWSAPNGHRSATLYGFTADDLEGSG